MPSLMSTADLAAFNADGFRIVRGMYDAAEVDLLRRAMEADPEVAGHMLDRLDAHGAATRIALWNRAGDSVYGMAARCARMVDTMEALLGGPVYHFQSKLTAKEPFVGGAWEWHQDYGYWYNYGCLAPSMLSCLIAVDRATQENGCLQVLEGSHAIGRVNHDRVNEQTVADPEHVEAARKRFPLVYMELDPGDAVFFDCNLLHRSDANKSEHRRWNYIASYNTVENQPYKRVREYGNYEPLVKVPDTAILDFTRQHAAQ
jgi:ectoine hydroxylase